MMVETLCISLSNGYSLMSRSKSMHPVFKAIDHLANVDVSVLVCGETGVGKELVGRALHEKGSRCRNPFVAVNCAAIPLALLESELLGHEKGAFTDARFRYIGKFERADSGTLLLDEIGDMDLGLQAKLLRVLQDKQVERIGSSELIYVDVRVVCTSNRDLRAMVSEGTFRSDLYWRISTTSIFIPPLRSRKSDIGLLIQHYLSVYSRKFGIPEPKISREFAERMIVHPWWGNVRELENIIQRSLIFSRGCRWLRPEHIHFDDK